MNLFHNDRPTSRKYFEKYDNTNILLVNEMKTFDHDTKLYTCLCCKRQVLVVFVFNLGLMVAMKCVNTK
jgi:hypothetical protein